MPMIMDGNLNEHWQWWKQKFVTYLKATEQDKKNEATQCAMLVHLIGEQGMRIYNTFNFNADERDKIAILIEKLDKHFKPQTNLILERHKLLTLKQRENESVDNYITSLKNVANNCELGDLKEDLLKDIFICGIFSSNLREKLLQENVKTLEEAVAAAHRYETARKENQLIVNGSSNGTTGSINAVNQQQKRVNPHQRQNRGYGNKKPGRNFSYQNSYNKSYANKCKFCNFNHLYGKCPAYGKICNICKKLNHFSTVCKSKNQNKKIGMINRDEEENTEETLFIGAVDKFGGESWISEVEIDGKKARFKLDTGAQANVIPQSMLRYLNYNLSDLKSTCVKLVSYTGDPLNVLGKCNLNCKSSNGEGIFTFFVMNGNSCVPVLGLSTCIALNLIKRVDNFEKEVKIGSKDNLNEIVQEYSDIFQGIGKLEKPCHIEIDKKIEPVVHFARKVPFSIQNKLKETLNSLERDKIIKKATDECPTWVNPIVIVHKPDGSLRICLDPKDLNKALKRHFYRIPTLEELTSELNGAKIFSTLDATQAFLQMQLDEESSKLCTFATPFGRYRFLRTIWS